MATAIAKEFGMTEDEIKSIGCAARFTTSAKSPFRKWRLHVGNTIWMIAIA